MFSAPMVRAILDGRKTVTRRTLKSPNADGCPYGQPGDRLWVRETCWLLGLVDDGEPRVVGLDASGEAGDPPRVWYAADGDRPTLPQYPPWCWLRRNSIHMPRWASRITLEVTSVGVERLHDITEDDARAEGVTTFPHDPEGDCWTDGKHRTAFEYLWGQINGPDSWAANPLVWRIQFRTVAA
jgi:hypothetical protein